MLFVPSLGLACVLFLRHFSEEAAMPEEKTPDPKAIEETVGKLDKFDHYGVIASYLIII
jgi:hypothetical protein